MPAAAPTFSTMIVCPRSSPMCSAWMRPLASMPPPAANGMTSVIGWVGQSCAKDALASAITAAEAVNIVLRILLSWQVGCWPKGQLTRLSTGARPGVNSRAHRAADQAPWRHRVAGGGSAKAQESGDFAGFAVGPPEHRRCFDQPFGAPECPDHGHHDSAAQRGRLQVVVEPDLDVGPVALIGLVPDGEVEIPDAVLDRMAQKLVQMRAARAKAHDLAVVIAGQHEIVAAAVGEPEARGRDGRADVEAADVGD